MLFSDAFRYLSSFSLFASQSSAVQAEDGRVKQIAIIGAGAAGSSAAYHLQLYAEQEGIEINVTIFEKTSRIGGRSLTVDVYDDPLQPVELGASIFVKLNSILFDATKAFNLTRVDPGSDEVGILGVWNGAEFVYQQDSTSWQWWNLAKLFWKYGSTPYYTRNLVNKVVKTFLKLYDEPYFPFRSLTTRAFELDLAKITGVTGTQFLTANKLDGLFAQHIVQTSTRVNYASNLAYIHGLETMVSMAADGAMAVKGGNWRIFANMVKASKAHINLNTVVSSLSVKTARGASLPSPKYTVETTDTESASASPVPYAVQFDGVIMATPHQFSNISHSENLFQHPIDDVPYVTLHVTLFATPLRFSPKFFNLKNGTEVPISVLTTLGKDEEPKPGAAAAGKAGFFSATLVSKVINPKTLGSEYVYKIFSPSKVTPEWLSSLLDADIPDTFTGPVTTNGDDNDDGPMPITEPISWYHATVFRPYPQELPRVTFQDPILRAGLYYTSGMESFISTMETSALMGKNVARLIIDDYIGLSRGFALSDNSGSPLGHDGQQVIKGGTKGMDDEL